MKTNKSVNSTKKQVQLQFYAESQQKLDRMLGYQVHLLCRQKLPRKKLV